MTHLLSLGGINSRQDKERFCRLLILFKSYQQINNNWMPEVTEKVKEQCFKLSKRNAFPDGWQYCSDEENLKEWFIINC